MTAQDCPNTRDTGAAKTELIVAHQSNDRDSDSNRDSDRLCFEVSEEMKGCSEASTSPPYGHLKKIKEEGIPHSSLLTLPFHLPVRIRNSKGQLKPDCAEDLPVPVPVPFIGGITVISSDISSSNNDSNSNISISNSISSNSNISINNISSSGSSDKVIDSIAGRQSDGDASRRANHSASIYPVGSAMQFARNKQ
jgi:hypothetical protein